MQVVLTDVAVTELQKAMKEMGKEGEGLKILVQPGGCAGFQYGLVFQKSPEDGDSVIEHNGVKIYVREEMAAIGGQEVHFPALIPREVFEASGRWSDYGDALFRLADRKGADYLLAVNGLPLDPTQEPYAAFQGLSDKPVFLTVNDKPGMEGSREVLVQTLASEARLRNLAWIDSNRRRVEQASGGKVGYVYVPDTGRHGQDELVRQFRGQIDKPALIIDERFNNGGQIPDRFVEMLGRTVLNYWAVRDGRDWSWPHTAHNGPKAMLINGWSGSGGDCFPFYFQKAGLGPLIGTRTWGGLIGMTGAPGLIDNGSVSVPTFGIYSTKGDWIIEGHGVDPDIVVVDDPSLMAKGDDPQLDRAVQELLKALKRNPPAEPKKPKYPLRAGR